MVILYVKKVIFFTWRQTCFAFIRLKKVGGKLQYSKYPDNLTGGVIGFAVYGKKSFFYFMPRYAHYITLVL